MPGRLPRGRQVPSDRDKLCYTSTAVPQYGSLQDLQHPESLLGSTRPGPTGKKRNAQTQNRESRTSRDGQDQEGRKKPKTDQKCRTPKQGVDEFTLDLEGSVNKGKTVDVNDFSSVGGTPNPSQVERRERLLDGIRAQEFGEGNKTDTFNNDEASTHTITQDATRLTSTGAYPLYGDKEEGEVSESETESIDNNPGKRKARGSDTEANAKIKDNNRASSSHRAKRQSRRTRAGMDKYVLNDFMSRDDTKIIARRVDGAANAARKIAKSDGFDVGHVSSAELHEDGENSEESDDEEDDNDSPFFLSKEDRSLLKEYILNMLNRVTKGSEWHDISTNKRENRDRLKKGCFMWVLQFVLTGRYERHAKDDDGHATKFIFTPWGLIMLKLRPFYVVNWDSQEVRGNFCFTHGGKYYWELPEDTLRKRILLARLEEIQDPTDLKEEMVRVVDYEGKGPAYISKVKVPIDLATPMRPARGHILKCDVASLVSQAMAFEQNDWDALKDSQARDGDKQKSTTEQSSSSRTHSYLGDDSLKSEVHSSSQSAAITRPRGDDDRYKTSLEGTPLDPSVQIEGNSPAVGHTQITSILNDHLSTAESNDLLDDEKDKRDDKWMDEWDEEP